MPDNKTIKKGFRIVDDETLTKEEFKAEFLTSFQQVLDFMNKTKQQNMEEFKAMNEFVKQVADKIKTDTDGSLADLKNELSTLINGVLKKIEVEHSQKMANIDTKLNEVKDGRDGLDADEEVIVDKVLSKIKLPEQKEIILDDAFEIRNKLETLNGEERLRIEDIDGLQEALEEVKSRRIGGGGFSKIAMDGHIVDDETPTGTVNGVNTDFVLAGIPNPSASLKVFKDGQRMKLTTDYTVSKKTISFVSAPLTDSIITCDYRT